MCDNQSAIKLVHNNEFHQRTKHINVKFHFIREKQQDKTVEVKYIETGRQPADMCTKRLSRERLSRCKVSVGLVPLLCLALLSLFVPPADAVFHSAAPVIWRESSQPVITGSISVSYRLEMIPACERYKGKDMKAWCSDLFERHIYPDLHHFCSM